MTTTTLDHDVDADVRRLHAITKAIHQLELSERSNIFERGRLIAEAKQLCNHSDWKLWLDTQFCWSSMKGTDYIKAFRLSLKFPTVLNLKVPSHIINDLTNNYCDDDLPVIVEALEKVASKNSITSAAATKLIKLTLLRVKHGDFPDATLYAVESLYYNTGWAEQAIKAECPDTKETADAVINRIHHKHVTALYSPHGPLPENVPNDVLYRLEYAPEEYREEVLKGVVNSNVPLTGVMVDNMIIAARRSARKEPTPVEQEQQHSVLREDFLEAVDEAQRLSMFDISEMPIDDEVLQAADAAAYAWNEVIRNLDARRVLVAPAQNDAE